MRKKLVSLLLTSCLAIGLISTTALAKDETLSKTVTTYRANLYGGSYETTVNVNVTDIPEDGTLEGKTVDDLLYATESVQYTDAITGRYSISLEVPMPDNYICYFKHWRSCTCRRALLFYQYLPAGSTQKS